MLKNSSAINTKFGLDSINDPIQGALARFIGTGDRLKYLDFIQEIFVFMKFLEDKPGEEDPYEKNIFYKQAKENFEENNKNLSFEYFLKKTNNNMINYGLEEYRKLPKYKTSVSEKSKNIVAKKLNEINENYATNIFNTNGSI